MSEPAAIALTPALGLERVGSIDVLRGVAVLGIFVMNLPSFAFSGSAYFNPLMHGGFEGLDRIAWIVCHVLFELKMMSLFSMLFGAGLVLMDERASARGRSIGAVYYRRIGWLALFGLAHAYVLWYGDILFLYAVCGVFLYPLRRLQPWTLLLLGAVLLCISPLINIGMGLGLRYAIPHAQAALDAIASGEKPTDLQQGMLEMWTGMSQQFAPSPAEILKETRAYLGPYGVYARHNAVTSLFMQVFVTALFGLWRCGGLMLVGMALLKLGVLSGRRSRGCYVVLAIIGLGAGLPLAGFGVRRLLASGFEPVATMTIDGQFKYVGSILVALGLVGLVHLVLRAGLTTWLTERLGAVGRMALTNYLMQTVIGTTLFCGWGFGLWARVGRAELLLVAAGVWALQLFISPWWLARFKFGPAEWLWRSLTYLSPQPMRLAAPPVLP